MKVFITISALMAFVLLTGGSPLSAQPPGKAPEPAPRGEREGASAEPADPRAPGRPPMPRRGERPPEPGQRPMGFPGDQPPPRDDQDLPGFGGPDARPGGMPGFERRPRDGRFPMGPPGMPGNWQQMQEDDPEMYKLLTTDRELERQTVEMAEQYRRAPAADREKLKAGLSELVGKHFEVRQERRELQLKRMEEEIQRLRDAIKARNDSREKIVTERITELTGEANPLDF